jgi:magnesium and cobalt transporter
MSSQKRFNKNKNNCDVSFFYCTKSSLINFFQKLINFSFKKTSTNNEESNLSEDSYSSDEGINKSENIGRNFEKFYSKVVEDVMIPRSSICSVKHDASAEDVFAVINKTGHTRILVYKDDLDNIIGFLHIKDLFKKLSEKKSFSINELIRTHVITATSTKLINLLALMKKKQVHIAVVVDEYGGTDGIVSIEDIIEELVGPINDEHDEEDRGYTVNNDGSINVDASIDVESLEKLLKTKLRDEEDEDDYDTVGGFVMSKIGHLPIVGEKFSITMEDNRNIKFEVIAATKRKILEIKAVVSN